MPSDELRYMNWQELMKPEKVQVTSNPSYCKFVCEPLERGFGITIGNSLRRIILSSLYLSLIHISEPTRRRDSSRMPSSA